MNWLSKLQLCLQTDGVSALRPLSDLVLADPTLITFQPFSTVIGKNGEGEELEMGFPVIKWQWNWLPQTDIAVLQGYERKRVYVRTETQTGTIRRFKVYAAYLQRLRLGDPIVAAYDGPPDGVRQKRSVEAEFSQGVEFSVAGSSFA